MKKYLFWLFLFIIFSHTVGAVELSTSVPLGSQYIPGRNYGFQIKCDDISNVSDVKLEWDGINNYTANNVSNSYFYNLSDLAAGDYSYKWIVNNVSDTLTFTSTYNILKNSSIPIILTLDGTTGDKSYERYKIANFIVTLNIPDKTVKLESTYPNWTTQTNTSLIYNSTNLTALGLFTITASWDGDENYTSSSKTYFFDSGPPKFSGTASTPSSPFGYVPDTEYKFQVNCKDATLVDVWFESNHTGSMKKYYSTSNLSVQNSSGVFWVTIKDLGAKKFSYKWHAKDGLDDESSTNFINYEILKMNPLVMEILPSSNIEEGTQITATCYSINSIEVPSSEFGFYKNSDLIENISHSTRMDTFLLSSGNYNFTCNTSGTENYTNQSVTREIIVSAGPPENGDETEGEFEVTSLYFPSLKTGESGEASFNLVNNMLKNIYNITIELSGISSSWYNIIQPSYVYSKETREVIVELSIPPDAEPRFYTITMGVTGDASDGEIVSITKSLDMLISSPIQNEPPSYFTSYTDATIAGSETMFSLEWSDDNGLSGYVFSSNNSGTWKNDSWVALTGKTGWINVTKVLNSSAGSVIGWRIYSNDTDNKWSASDEYIVKVTGGGFDILLVVVVLVIVIILIVVIIIFIRKRKPKKKKEKVEYVYSRTELRK